MSGFCCLCGGPTRLLPVPHAAQSLLSDGRVWPHALRKRSCLGCGVVSHVEPPSAATMASFYGTDYGLQHHGIQTGKTRDTGYARHFAAALPAPRRALEIGCGTGQLLSELALLWPDAELVGVDPSLALPSPEDRARVSLIRASIESYADGGERYDLLLSVNAIEHLPDVDAFFASAARLLAADGVLALICPAAVAPNQELLFFDHVHTLTQAALRRAAARYGLQLLRAQARLALGDFQFLLFGRNGDVARIEPEPGGAALATARTAYLGAWAGLDAQLLARTGGAGALAIFGAGQMAALLRTYAPRVWGCAAQLLVDDPEDAWELDKPLVRYAARAADAGEIRVIAAATPAIQDRIARRLGDDGYIPIRFDDIIPA